ncbi:hypothetical protein ACFB49_13370 [Sphingomonas sp. DBB INV C78]|uniref:GtrA family protein n=1 Tax=Sphingomonas sp. DBB INV C78 TaxID=3349434 RepID=UPI0036D28116
MIGRKIGAFGLVGGASTLAYIALALGFGRLGLHAVAASFAAYLVGMVISYAGHRHLTFASRRPHSEALPRFVLVNLFGVGLSLAAPFLLTVTFGLPPAVAVATTTILVPLASFVGHNRFVFPQRSDA